MSTTSASNSTNTNNTTNSTNSNNTTNTTNTTTTTNNTTNNTEIKNETNDGGVLSWIGSWVWGSTVDPLKDLPVLPFSYVPTKTHLLFLNGDFSHHEEKEEKNKSIRNNREQPKQPRYAEKEKRKETKNQKVKLEMFDDHQIKHKFKYDNSITHIHDLDYQLLLYFQTLPGAVVYIPSITNDSEICISLVDVMKQTRAIPSTAPEFSTIYASLWPTLSTNTLYQCYGSDWQWLTDSLSSTQVKEEETINELWKKSSAHFITCDRATKLHSAAATQVTTNQNNQVSLPNNTDKTKRTIQNIEFVWMT